MSGQFEPHHQQEQFYSIDFNPLELSDTSTNLQNLQSSTKCVSPSLSLSSPSSSVLPLLARRASTPAVLVVSLSLLIAHHQMLIMNSKRRHCHAVRRGWRPCSDQHLRRWIALQDYCRTDSLRLGC